MAEVHAVAGWVVLAVVACFLIVSIVLARLREGDRLDRLDRAGRALTALLVVQVALGLLTFLSGRRPSEPLHFLYGAAVVGVLPLASSFASEAPPRARSAVMAVACVIVLGLVWRVFATG